MQEWIKPNKTKIMLNELPDTVAHAEKLRWKPLKKTAAQKKADEEAEMAALQEEIDAEESE